MQAVAIVCLLLVLAACRFCGSVAEESGPNSAVARAVRKTKDETQKGLMIVSAICIGIVLLILMLASSLSHP